MASLVPFGGSSAANPIDELLNGFFVRPVSFDGWNSERAAQVRMDVYETENAYRVVADLPGLRKEDIDIAINGAEVTVSAEAKREKTVGDGEKALLNERFAGKYQRTFALGYEIDEANAQAKYADGVLELTLPKSPNAMPKKIPIQ
jgi:HSP20 family protein